MRGQEAQRSEAEDRSALEGGPAVRNRSCHCGFWRLGLGSTSRVGEANEGTGTITRLTDVSGQAGGPAAGHSSVPLEAHGGSGHSQAGSFRSSASPELGGHVDLELAPWLCPGLAQAPALARQRISPSRRP